MSQQNVNTGLLVADDTPIKIYLDGFDVLDFLRTAKIIRMHGGNVSKPSHDTLILTPPNRQPSTKFIQFSTGWLYDSIKHNTRQDVGKYLLPPAVPLDPPDATEIQHGPDSPGATQELKKSPQQEKTNDSSGFDERSEDQEMSAEESADDTETDDSSVASATTSMTSLAEDQPSSSPQPEATKDGPTEPATSDTPEVIREEIVENSAPGEVGVLSHEALDVEVQQAGNEEASLCLSDPPADQRHLYKLVNGCWRFKVSTLELEKVPQIALDHHFSPESTTAAALSPRVYEAQRKAAKARRKRIHPMMVTKRSRKRARTDSLPKIKYTSAEDQKIIEYLIERDAISMVDGHSVWDDMARDEESLRGRSGASLKYRFTTNLRYNFRQYTDDPAALRQFEALAADSRPAEK